MNHHRKLAAALACALAVSLCAGAALASETAPELPGDAPVISPAPILISPAPKTEAGEEKPSQDIISEDIPATDDPATVETQPAAATLAFGELSARMRAGYYSLLSLEETINSLKVIDYDEMKDDLRDALNDLVDIQFFMDMMGSTDTTAKQSLKSTYDSLRDTFDDLSSGKFQQDQNNLIRQLEHAQDQIVMAGESLYIALVELEQTDATLARNLDTLDRTLAELDIRYEMGQISSLALAEAKAGRSSLLSGRSTLDMNRTNLLCQLQAMIGEEVTGQLTLSGLPTVTQSELDGMDPTADLEKAKAASYDLLAARVNLEDAKEAYDDACDEYNMDTRKYEFLSAQHTWQAAQHTHAAAVQNYELSFRSLYAQVKDFEQVLAASKVTLAVKQDNLAAAQIKFEQGVISRFDLLDAQDAVATAQDSVNSAAIDLFTTYHNYCWAVERGILN